MVIFIPWGDILIPQSQHMVGGIEGNLILCYGRGRAIKCSWRSINRELRGKARGQNGGSERRLVKGKAVGVGNLFVRKMKRHSEVAKMGGGSPAKGGNKLPG